MNWILALLLIQGSNENIQHANKNEKDTINKKHETDIDSTPDMAMLLFLAEWDVQEGDQWLDPDVFTKDTEFNQQLDEIKANKDEKDSDNN